MSLPKICVFDKSIFLLSGYNKRTMSSAEHGSSAVMDEEKLRLAVELHPDAVAFGYIAGE
jgi:hypothetical protein